MMKESVFIRCLDVVDYVSCWQAMQKFTQERNETTPDEIWVLEHPPVFTQGQNGKPEHLLNPGIIPVIKIDRGGQITYHGPGQLVMYTLIDLKRKKLNIRELVTLLENSVIYLLKDLGIEAKSKREAPGVYVNNAKICSIGLRIRKGCSYHGLAFNINMDLEPFSRINPCGFSNLRMTQLSELIGPSQVKAVGLKLTQYLIGNLGYTSVLEKDT